MAMLEIREVIGRAAQGITRPFICRAADGHIYYVKGRGAGYASLAKELIAGRLAQRLGLPIADFAVLSAPHRLVDIATNQNISDLGHGPVFGSKAVEGVAELSMANLKSMDAEVIRDIAAYDWWVRNGDRTLSPNGGNPNILWSSVLRRPTIIDHNLAFDDAVTFRSLAESHIFGFALQEIAATPSFHAMYSERFEDCLSGWDEICCGLPERWLYADDRMTVATGFSPSDAEKILNRYRSGSMWAG